MEREFLFNFDALDNYISEQEKDPNWTVGQLAMLRDNCKKYLKDSGKDSKEYTILINEDTGDVTINGQKDLKDKFKMLPTGYEMSNKDKLYRQVKLSMDYAERVGIYDQIFKEIRKDLDSLKESIENPNK